MAMQPGLDLIKTLLLHDGTPLECLVAKERKTNTIAMLCASLKC